MRQLDLFDLVSTRTESKPMRPERTLSVSTLRRELPRHSLAEPYVPHLRLTGRWLEAAGFPAGTKVKALISAGKIIITPE